MSNGSITFNPNRKQLIVAAKYNPVLITTLKELVPQDKRKYVQENKTWLVAVDQAERLVKFAEEFDLSTPADMLKAQEEQQELRKALLEASKAKDTPISLDIPALVGELRPYQKAGISYLLQAKRSIQADDMGLGKTVQALATVEASGDYPALVIAPASLTLNWKAEANRWLPGRKVQVIRKGTDKLDLEADFVICTYDIAKKKDNELSTRGFKSVIADEAHYLKNGQSQRTKAVSGVVGSIPRAHLLTGTPVTNRPADLIAPLRMLGHLDGDFGGWMPFAKRYCDAYQNRFGWDLSGANHLSELNTKLRGLCMVRRTKGEVLTELPAKQRSIQPVELSNRADYNRASRDLVDYLSSSNDEDYSSSEGEVLVLLNRLKQLAGEGKVEAAKEAVQGYLDAEKKVVVFAHHYAVLDAIEAQLKADSVMCVRIDGQTKVEDRQKCVEAFQNNPACKVFLGTTKAAGVGITLTASSDVLVVEQEWVPADLDQAEDRTHRIGQLNAVNCIHLIAEDSVDQKLLEVVEAKRAIAHEAITGEGEQLKAVRSTSVLSEVLASYKAEAKGKQGHTKTRKPKPEHKVRKGDAKALVDAAKAGNLAEVKELLSKEIPVEACSEALVASAEAEHMDCVKELLSKSAFDPAKQSSMKPEMKTFIESYFEGQSLRANLPSLVKPVLVEHEVQKLGRVA